MATRISAVTFTPATDAIAGSLTASALVGLAPLLTFFVLLAGFKLKAWYSGLGALVVALVVAIIGFDMPAPLAGLSALQGITFGLFPVMWIVITAIWFYELTVVSGRFEDLRRIFNSIGHGDMRVQAMLIAFCFGGMLEALAGFGAPVAITGAMLVTLGMPALRAAVTVLIANTAPVAFGAMAIPITTAGALTDIPATEIAAVVGRQTPVLALVVPLLLLFLVDGRRGVRQAWPIALVTGTTFALAQFWCSSHFSYELTDVVASLAGLTAAVLMLQVWKPRTPEDQLSRTRTRTDAVAVQAGKKGPGGAHAPQRPVADESLTASRVVMALFPYLLVITVFGIAKLWTVGVDLPERLAATDVKIEWPGLYGNLITGNGDASSSAVYTFSWLSSPGTLLLLSGAIVTLVYARWDSGGMFPLTVRRAAATFGTTVVRMKLAIATVATVLGLSYVMNQSGQTVAIGTWLAGTGAIFALFSPILGWLGTAVTGSDTSANALFARLQQAAGQTAGIDPTLLVAANTSGGVVGKLISPQNLTIAATAVDRPGSESVLLRKVIGYSVAMLVILCVLVYLQSTPVLSWMLP
ncbi:MULTISPECIES: L-lactate permease [Rhodococcus]|uniref:L-lactate permease n=1 Tax=Rhodococcus TaxID=1827 RepID=UPI001E485344|nr:L-lactate permease [Rhodococcus pyridinivorans]MCD2118617.1 L-lactate permease [Rhodococcus pyridinivorans]MCZ4627488.1 L-lactate permease [Rhodococcus pyridinivorans]MCZ4649094.1 L-lactate permease [Rhodococcus pyridinivorans]MDJ0483298.1 L-lactate permease [Rhodococcus pyridinivorans]MDV7254774.1 L-lactate permease [Rhodococcus pyridinivorans]